MAIVIDMFRVKVAETIVEPDGIPDRVNASSARLRAGSSVMPAKRRCPFPLLIEPSSIS